jgi:signal transduction histidine kinase
MAQNNMARTYFGSLGNTQIDGAQLPYLLGSLTLDGAAEGRSWWDVMDKSLAATRARARDLRGRDLLIRVVPWNNAAGDLSGWVATIDDVSAIRTSERRRDEALNFMSTSLNAAQHNILEALATLDVSQLGPTEAALTQSIGASSSDALALTDKFVELSNAESRDYDFVACDISDAIELAVDAVYTIAEKHRAKISYFRPDSPVIANIDTSMLSRAVSILLANAVRFAPSGESVDVAVVQNSEVVILRVSDHGRGISPSDQVRMLRALQDIQLPGASRGAGGYMIGLGLSLVRTVAEKHHGKLEFTSNPGKGSEFRIVLPSWSTPIQPLPPEDSVGEAAL